MSLISRLSAAPRVFNMAKRCFCQTPMCLKKHKEPKVPPTKKKTEMKQPQLSPMDREMVQYLTKQLVEERRVQLKPKESDMLDDFVIYVHGAEFVLAKEDKKERVEIFCNVSKSVLHGNDDKNDKTAPKIRSTPNFEVLIRRGSIVFSIYCIFLPNAFNEASKSTLKSYFNGNSGSTEIFKIEELSIYDTNWTETCYTIETSMMDDGLNDIFMRMLFEKGITHEFAVKLSDLATFYEHDAYIDFLQMVSKFSTLLPQS